MKNAFPITRYSLLARLKSPGAGTPAVALDALLAAYWRPVHTYLRVKWRVSTEDAQDLTQAFFDPPALQRLLERYESNRGKFRTYLRTCLDGFLSNQRKAASRQKRGGQASILSMESDGAGSALEQPTPGDPSDLEEYFHREWVRNLFGLAVDAFRAEASASGKAIQFSLFERYDLERDGGKEELSYQALAQEFGISTTQVTNFLAFARREFRRIVLEKLAELCATDEEFRDEARQILGVREP